MDSSKSFQLNIKRAYFLQFGEEHPVKIDHLKFAKNGEVFMEGSDDVGNFKITGELKNNYLYLTKEYIGQHTVYYLGRLANVLVEMVYEFSPEWDVMKTKLESNEIMAGMEFETTTYKLLLKDSGVTVNLLLSQDMEKPNRYRGIASKDNHFVIVNAKIKKEKCKVKFIAKDHKEEFEGKYDPSSSVYVVDKE